MVLFVPVPLVSVVFTGSPLTVNVHYHEMLGIDNDVYEDLLYLKIVSLDLTQGRGKLSRSIDEESGLPFYRFTIWAYLFPLYCLTL
jgi:hypothetical protein